LNKKTIYRPNPSCCQRSTKVRMETYDAAGSTLVEAYDYLAGMVYQETIVASVSNKTLDFIASPEGRAIPKAKVNPADVTTTGDQMKFEYNLKDHLGNLRVSCRCGEPKRDAQGVIIPEGQPGAGIDAVAVVQEPWGRLGYDAWGLAFNAGTVSTSGTPPGEIENRKDKFTYNCQELVSDLNLGWNDYGFRMYDAIIGRWSVVDPLVENRNWLTPYNYVQNNPIVRIDPNGALDANARNFDQGSKFIREDVFEQKRIDAARRGKIGDSPTCPKGKEFNVYRENRNLFTYAGKGENGQNIVLNGDGSGPVINGKSHKSTSKDASLSSGDDFFDDLNTSLGAFDIAQGAKGELISYASKANPAINELKYVKGLKVLGGATFIISSGISIGLAGKYYATGGKNSSVAIKATIYVIMGGVGILRPIGFGLSATYFLLDSSGAFGGYGDPSLTPKK
jgi:RHS repeat-associated protein